LTYVPSRQAFVHPTSAAITFSFITNPSVCGFPLTVHQNTTNVISLRLCRECMNEGVCEGKHVDIRDCNQDPCSTGKLVKVTLLLPTQKYVF